MNTYLNYNVLENPDTSWTYSFSWPDTMDGVVLFDVPYTPDFGPSFVTPAWEWDGPVTTSGGLTGFSFTDVRTPVLSTVEFTHNNLQIREPENAWVPNTCVPEPCGIGYLIPALGAVILTRRCVK